MEKLVIDANVVISALIKRGFAFDLIVGLRERKTKYLNILSWKRKNWIF